MTDTDRELIGRIGSCLKSAVENFDNRMPRPEVGVNYHALDDIETDLRSALKATEELFRRRKARDLELFGRGAKQ